MTISVNGCWALFFLLEACRGGGYGLDSASEFAGIPVVAGCVNPSKSALKSSALLGGVVDVAE